MLRFAFVFGMIGATILTPAAGWGGVEDDDATAALTAAARNPSLVIFRAGAVDPLQDSLHESSRGLTDWRDAQEGPVLWVVQYHSTPGPEERAHLTGEGAEILHYLPNNAFLVRTERGDSLRWARGVRAAFRLPKWAKIDPQIHQSTDSWVNLDVLSPEGRNALGVADYLTKTHPQVNFMAISGSRNGGRGSKCRREKGFMRNLSEPERSRNLFRDIHVAHGQENEIGKSV